MDVGFLGCQILQNCIFNIFDLEGDLKGSKKNFLAKLIIFPNSGDQNTPTLIHKLFFRKIFIFEKSVQSGNSEKIYIPMPYQVGDFFILLSSIYTFNGISISFIIFRSRFKFILTPLIMYRSKTNLS